MTRPKKDVDKDHVEPGILLIRTAFFKLIVVENFPEEWQINFLRVGLTSTFAKVLL